MEVEMELHEIDPQGDLLMQLVRFPKPEVEEDEDEENVEDDDEMDVEEGEDEDKEEVKDQAVHFRCSSRHMILASPCFRSMLDSDSFSEGSTLRSEGSVEIPFPEDNPDAFLIILRIIHGMTRQVPREVDLEMLTEIESWWTNIKC
jgi:hypothetical protein